MQWLSMFNIGVVLLSICLISMELPKTEAACEVKNVIIIGAGISGTAAAHRIVTTRPDCFKVTVLEARNRVGGRMWSRTATVNGMLLRADMGAQWIQSATGGNPITALARQMKLPIGEMNDEEQQYSVSGQAYSDSQANKAYAAYEGLVKKAIKYAYSLDKDISLDKAFRAVDSKLYLTPYVQNQAAVDYEFEYGGSLEKLSAWYFNSDGTFGPGDWIVTNGYDQIPKNLMAQAQQKGADLHLNFLVTSISQSSTGVQVTGKDSKGAVQTFSGHYVINTLPLGILKARRVAFSPDLSAKKAQAISQIGFGFTNKIVFFFNKPFWTTGVNEYFIESSPVPQNRSEFFDWINLLTPWKQTALMGVSTAAYAVRMAVKTDAEVIADAQAKMYAMFPAGKTMQGLQLLGTFIQRWNTDPYALGSYSYAKVGMKEGAYDTMAKPEGRVFFAGEHTNNKFRSTVHGAYLSGIREAKRVLSSA